MFGHTDGIKEGSARVDGDSYYTPIPLVQAIVPLLGVQPGARVLEPSAGGGSWARTLVELGARVHAVDVDPNAWVNVAGRDWSDAREAADDWNGGKLRTRCVDFLGYSPDAVEGRRRPFDWAIGNPPYSAAEAHVRHALALSDRVAFLLRGGFLASAERLPLWREFGPHLTDAWFLAERPREWDASYDYVVLLWDQTQRVDHFRGRVFSWR